VSEYEKVIKKLESLSLPKAIIGMAKYEVVSENPTEYQSQI